MLGHALFKHFFNKESYSVTGTVRSSSELQQYFTAEEADCLISGVDAENFDSIIRAFELAKPDVVINSIGIIKHLPEAKDYYKSILVNSLLPQRLAKLAAVASARLIQISTDCVFDGVLGNYKESDLSNAEDLYGKSKYLGEVDYPHALTIRTSIIGHELKSNISLVDWFLTQHNPVNGYTNAIYTGLPTYELADIIESHVLPNPELKGLYHVSADPINKYDLLCLVSRIYNKDITINPFTGFVLNRALDSTKFRTETGYKPRSWHELITLMHLHFTRYECYRSKHLRTGN